MRTSEKVRNAFVQYFQKQNHFFHPHSPLIPNEIDTTMFTIAGMKQFSNIFLGKQEPKYSRAVTVQPCLRLGGKNSDLEMVGKTTRHNTFFEMLGNFSFYDYFKEEAIFYAFDFLTNYLNLPEKYLYITIHEEDLEARKIWTKILGSDDKIFKLKSNFWKAGNTGPCGPCTEIFFDTKMENHVTRNIVAEHLNNDTDRFLEIWNVVFIQYNMDHKGDLEILKNKSVDTGAGLERICGVIDQTFDNFRTDLLSEIVVAANQSKLSADHYKSIVFLINEGLRPGNESREYILRKLIRRTALYCNNPAPIVNTVISTMNNYEFIDKKIIIEVIEKELEQFSNILDKGRKILDDCQNIDENFVVELYQTHGFPMYITLDLLENKKINLNLDKIEELKELHIKNSSKKITIDFNQATEILCYEKLNIKTKITFVQKYEDFYIFCTESSCFYARGGGQEGDRGTFFNSNVRGDIIDTLKQSISNSEYMVLHLAQIEVGSLKVGDEIELIVNEKLRLARARAHSATHIMGDYLLKRFNNEQKGSFVDDDSFRYDFNTTESLKPYWNEIMRDVNEIIMKNLKTETEICQLEEVNLDIKEGHNYGEIVRVIGWDKYSKQLCGGTHVTRSGDIGTFVITKETPIKQGIRRIEALTGYKAIDYILNQLSTRDSNGKKEEARKIGEQSTEPIIKSYENYFFVYIEKGNEQYILKHINTMKKENKPIVLLNENKIFLHEINLNIMEALKANFSLKGGGKDLIRLGREENIDCEELESFCKKHFTK